MRSSRKRSAPSASVLERHGPANPDSGVEQIRRRESQNVLHAPAPQVSCRKQWKYRSEKEKNPPTAQGGPRRLSEVSRNMPSHQELCPMPVLSGHALLLELPRSPQSASISSRRSGQCSLISTINTNLCAQWTLFSITNLSLNFIFPRKLHILSATRCL